MISDRMIENATEANSIRVDDSACSQWLETDALGCSPIMSSKLSMLRNSDHMKSSCCVEDAPKDCCCLD